jgi:hypothetical protein
MLNKKDLLELIDDYVWYFHDYGGIENQKATDIILTESKQRYVKEIDKLYKEVGQGKFERSCLDNIEE